MASTQPVDVQIRMEGVDNASGVMNRVTNQHRRMTNQMGRSNGVFVRHRRTIQQVGFQVGDFATQIAGGQSAMLAFTQQGGQLLQFFGPFGAAAAGALAVWGSMVIATTRSGKAFSDFSSIMGILEDDFIALGKAIGVMKEAVFDGINLVVNNLDRVLVIAGTVAAFFLVKWVAAFAVARIATFSLLAALIRLKTFLMRFLPTAALIGLGELVFRFLQVRKAVGGTAEAFKLFKEVVAFEMDRIKQLLNLGKEFLFYLWIPLKAGFIRVMAEIRQAFAGTLRSLGEALSGSSLFGTLVGNTLTDAADSLMPDMDAVGANVEYALGAFRDLNASLERHARIVLGETNPALAKLRDALAELKKSDFDIRDLFSGLGDDDDGDGGGKKKLTDLQTTLTSGFDRMFDAVFEGSKSAIQALRDLGQELLKLIAKQRLYAFLAQAFPGVFGASGTVPLSIPTGFAKGGVVQPFASGGVVNRPTLFPMASGAGLMGERGPEAIMPLTRTSGGRLGVAAQGGGSQVNIQIVNTAGVGIRRERTTGSDGRQLERFILETVGRGATSGDLDSSMAGRFGARPTRLVR